MENQRLNHKKLSSTSINTNTTYFLSRYVQKQNYCNVLYLLIKKKFTYFAELRRVFNITTDIHLPKLEDEGLVTKRYATQQERDLFLELYPTTPKHYFNKKNIYELTDLGLEIFTNPKIYELICIFSKKEKADNFILYQSTEYDNIKFNRERAFNLKIQRAINKLPQYRTAEDWALLQLERSNK